MYKTLQIEIEDLIEYLKKEVWSQEVSLDIYGTSKEDAYLSGINEGIDRAYRVLADLNIKGYIIQERNK
jgi:hypothetical protein